MCFSSLSISPVLRIKLSVCPKFSKRLVTSKKICKIFMLPFADRPEIYQITEPFLWDMSQFGSSIYKLKFFHDQRRNYRSFGRQSLKYQSVWKHALPWCYMELSKAIPKGKGAKSGNLKACYFMLSVADGEYLKESWTR